MRCAALDRSVGLALKECQITFVFVELFRDFL